MTLNPLMLRERVVIPDRPAPSKAQKVRVWNRENGICYLCGKPVALEGPNVQYDHRDMRGITGDDSDANLYPTHPACHAVKTATQDAPRNAKTKRQERLTRPREKRRSSLSHPTLRKKMNGEVVPR